MPDRWVPEVEIRRLTDPGVSGLAHLLDLLDRLPGPVESGENGLGTEPHFCGDFIHGKTLAAGALEERHDCGLELTARLTLGGLARSRDRGRRLDHCRLGDVKRIWLGVDLGNLGHQGLLLFDQFDQVPHIRRGESLKPNYSWTLHRASQVPQGRQSEHQLIVPGRIHPIG